MQKGKTPLHLAAQEGRAEVCSLLLQMGASASAVDANGQTPLHLASESDHAEVVQLFLRHLSARAAAVGGATRGGDAAGGDGEGGGGGSSPTTQMQVASADQQGMTYAHIAAARGSLAVVHALAHFSRELVCHAKNVNSATPLHLAVAGGHVEVVKFLLQLGASPLEENNVRVLSSILEFHFTYYSNFIFLLIVHWSANF